MQLTFLEIKCNITTMKKLLLVFLLTSNICFGKSIYDATNDVIQENQRKDAELKKLADNPKYQQFFDGGYVDTGNINDLSKLSIIKNVLEEYKNFNKKSYDDKMFSEVFNNNPTMSAITDYNCYINEIYKSTKVIDYMKLDVEMQMTTYKQAEMNQFISDFSRLAFEKCIDMDAYEKYNSKDNIRNKLENEFRHSCPDCDDDFIKTKVNNIIESYNICKNTGKETTDTDEVRGNKIQKCLDFYKTNIEDGIKKELKNYKNPRSSVKLTIELEWKGKYYGICQNYYNLKEDCEKILK